MPQLAPQTLTCASPTLLITNKTPRELVGLDPHTNPTPDANIQTAILIRHTAVLSAHTAALSAQKTANTAALALIEKQSVQTHKPSPNSFTYTNYSYSHALTELRAYNSTIAVHNGLIQYPRELDQHWPRITALRAQGTSSGFLVSYPKMCLKN